MSNYILIYYGNSESVSPDDATERRARWQAWVDGLGDAVITPGIPIGTPKTVSSASIADGTRADRVTGFTMVKADSLDAALEMAKHCPYLEEGTIDVAETFTIYEKN